MLQIKNTLGGGKPEGMYVWKKYGYIPEQTIVNPTFHIKANVGTQKATITSDDINFKAFGTLTDSNNFYQSREPEFCNFMNRFENSNSSVNFAISTSTYSGQLELNYSNNSYWNAFTKMTPTNTGAELTASNLFKTTIDDTLQYTGTKTIAAMIGDFISYVVSDKETAYPDGGEKGGYWYEKVGEGITPEMFGYTKMAIDKYTPTMDSYTNTLKVNHSLGIIPKRIFILVDMNDFQEDDSSNYLVFADIALSPNEKYMTSISRSSTFNMANYPWSGGYSEGDVSPSYNTSWNITSKLFIFNTRGSFKYKAGTEYTIISMA